MGFGDGVVVALSNRSEAERDVEHVLDNCS